MTDVFISYRRTDRARVEEMAEALRDLDLKVWFDRDLRPGRAFPAEIERIARSCRAMIVCWTADATQSEWVLREAGIGLERDVLAPVSLERCVLPQRYAELQTINLTKWAGALDDLEWLDLLRHIGDLTDRDDLPKASCALANGRREELVARLRRYLVTRARQNDYAYYAEAARALDIDQQTLWAALDALAEENRSRREPPLCALVINEKTSGLPGKGYFQKQAFLPDDRDPLASAVWGRHRDCVWDFDWPHE
jgi:hypothetical protein